MTIMVDDGSSVGESDATGRFMRELGLNENAWNTRVIVHEAMLRGVAVTRVGQTTGVRLAHDGIVHRWRNSINSLNSRLMKRVAGNKVVASQLLRAYGAPALENAVFQRGEERRAWAWAAALGAVVVKPVNAKRGLGVHVELRDKRSFVKAFRDVSSTYPDVVVERYTSGSEYRFLLVQNRLVSVIQRRPASVLGDGTSTVEELVFEKNLDRGPVHKPLRLGRDERDTLSRIELHPRSVPEKDQRVFLRTNLNLHQGGDAIIADHHVSDHEKAVVEEAAQAFPGAGLLGMDVILPRDPGDAGIGIIEVNSAPLISMHHFPWKGQPINAAGTILDAMFPGTVAR